MNTSRSNKGFTLVEIMIVVVIIGLLAAMAIPAFQKVRQSSIEKTVINDARQLGSAAQQYFMENGVATVACSTDASSVVQGPLSVYVSRISKANSLINVNLTTTATITVSNAALLASGSAPAGARWFTPEGTFIP